MLAKKKVEKEGIPNLAELLEMVSFYKQVDRDIATPLLLKYGGFNIKGLQGTKEGISGSQGHALAWNETLSVGLCFCGWKGTEGWAYAMTKIQYDMHKRRADDTTN